MKFAVIVGSYERVVYGIDETEDSKVDVKTVKESFAIPAHTGYIKSVASCPRFLVSGGTDETIRIFDLRKRKDVGSLSQHDGSICSLAFSGSTHLLTAGEDGRIGLFRTKDWECLHVLRHKTPIQSIAIHPSGKIALSAGAGKSLKLWNLMVGKQAYSLRLRNEPLRITFSESGKYFAILSDFNVALFETELSKEILDFRSPTRLNSLKFLKDEHLYLAGEGSLVQVLDIAKSSNRDTSIQTFDTGQTPRIKDMAIIAVCKLEILITADSSGLIKAWGLPDWKELFSHNSGIRVTCLTATATA